jgi:hypothetical protein
VDGRTVPTYHVSRDPRTWGWILQSAWALYASVPLPPRHGRGGELDDAALCLTPDQQLDEIRLFNSGLPLDTSDFAWCHVVLPLTMLPRCLLRLAPRAEWEGNGPREGEKGCVVVRTSQEGLLAILPAEYGVRVVRQALPAWAEVVLGEAAMESDSDEEGREEEEDVG